MAFLKRPRLKIPINKHGNIKCWVHKLEPILVRKKPTDEQDWLKFDSLKEANRYIELLRLQRQGFISELTRQVPYKLLVNQIVIGKMILDFVYRDENTKEYVIEDVKGKATQLWLWKQKHFEAQFGKKIIIT